MKRLLQVLVMTLTLPACTTLGPSKASKWSGGCKIGNKTGVLVNGKLVPESYFLSKNGDKLLPYLNYSVASSSRNIHNKGPKYEKHNPNYTKPKSKNRKKVRKAA
jgi:hypothetical protein